MTDTTTLPPLPEAIREALYAARGFIRNGIALGYIRMPDPDTPDPAHETLPKIESAIAALAQPTLDPEALIRSCIPGGSVCDPQQVADAVRRYLDAWPQEQCARAPALAARAERAEAAQRVPLTDEAEFEVWQDDELQASASGPRAYAWQEAMRYAAQYAQDGVVRVFEVSRREVGITATEPHGERE